MSQPDHGGGQVKHREKAQGSLLEAGGDATVMLDFIDEALDAMSQTIGVFIVGEFDTA